MKLFFVVLLASILACTVSAGGTKEAAMALLEKTVLHLENVELPADLKAASDSISTAPGNKVLLFEPSRDGGRFVFLRPSGEVDRAIATDIKSQLVSACSPHQGEIVAYVRDLAIDREAHRIMSIDQKILVLDSSGEQAAEYLLPSIHYEQDRPFTDSIAVGKSGDIYFLAMGELLVLRKGAKEPAAIGRQRYWTMALDGDENIYVSWYATDSYQTHVARMSGRTGKIAWDITFGYTVKRLMWAQDSERLFALDDRGIAVLGLGGDPGSHILDLRSTDLVGIVTCYLSPTILQGNVPFILVHNPDITEDSKAPPLLAYIGVRGIVVAKKEPEKKKIVISHMYYYDHYLDTAIKEYTKSNSNIEITVAKTLYQDDLFGNYSQRVIDQLSTQIMSGNTPDIIMANGLPWPLYCRRGLLLNVEPYVRDISMYDPGSYFTNVINGVRTSGGQYVVPLSFSLNPLWANQMILSSEGIEIDDRNWSLDDFYRIALGVRKDADGDGIFERTGVRNVSGLQFFMSYIYPGVLRRYCDFDSGNFDLTNPEFISVLEKSKVFVDENNRQNPNTADKNLWDLMAGGKIVFEASFGVTNSVGMIAQVSDLFRADVTLLRRPSTSPDSQPFYCSSIFGIYAESKVVSEAWDFLRYMCTLPFQESRDMFRFPVSRQAYESGKQWQIDYAARYGLRFRNGVVREIPAADIEALESYFPDLRYLRRQDDEMVPVIIADLGRFYSGEISAKKAAGIMQNKLKLASSE